jgi:hypothetical protein
MKQFCTYLGFSEDDLDNSLIAIEGFVLEHWEQLDYLQDKQDYQRVSDHFISRISKIAEKNKSRLLKEIQDSGEVLTLLKKARTEELTTEESERIRHELILMLKTIPTFVIISLPQRFLTLPMLMKILPKNLFYRRILRIYFSSASAVFFPARDNNREHDGQSKCCDDYREGEQRVKLDVKYLQHHFCTDEEQDDRKALLK